VISGVSVAQQTASLQPSAPAPGLSAQSLEQSGFLTLLERVIQREIITKQPGLTSQALALLTSIRTEYSQRPANRHEVLNMVKMATPELQRLVGESE